MNIGIFVCKMHKDNLFYSYKMKNSSQLLRKSTLIIQIQHLCNMWSTMHYVIQINTNLNCWCNFINNIFINPSTGANTLTVECLWSTLKIKMLWKMYSHLIEAWYRSIHTLIIFTINFVQNIRKMYSKIQKIRIVLFQIFMCEIKF